jgi:hypothetical protein
MSTESQDDRRQREQEGVSEDAGKIEGLGLQAGGAEDETGPAQPPQDPPEELEEERRG